MIFAFFFTSSALTKKGQDTKRLIDPEFKQGGQRNWYLFLSLFYVPFFALFLLFYLVLSYTTTFIVFINFLYETNNVFIAFTSVELIKLVRMDRVDFVSTMEYNLRLDFGVFFTIRWIQFNPLT
jgi:hypothetical protein